MNRAGALIGKKSNMWKGYKPVEYKGPDQALRNQSVEHILWDDTKEQARARPHRALRVTKEFEFYSTR